MPLAGLVYALVGTLLFSALRLWVLRQLPELRHALRSPRERRALFASGVLIALNWAVFIYLWELIPPARFRWPPRVE